MPRQRKQNPQLPIYKKQCKYIGSQAISIMQGEERQNYVNEKLMEMKDVGKGISVVLLVTDEGIKVMSVNESSVKMAHSITKIAFSTCHPDKRLFAYVARGKANDNEIIQAHMFRAKKTHHTQRFNGAIKKALHIAYTRTTTKRLNRGQLFEKEAEVKKEEIKLKKKRWAKNEMAHGHDNSNHALRARKVSSSSGNALIVTDIDIGTPKTMLENNNNNNSATNIVKNCNNIGTKITDVEIDKNKKKKLSSGNPKKTQSNSWVAQIDQNPSTGQQNGTEEVKQQSAFPKEVSLTVESGTKPEVRKPRIPRKIAEQNSLERGRNAPYSDGSHTADETTRQWHREKEIESNQCSMEFGREMKKDKSRKISTDSVGLNDWDIIKLQSPHHMSAQRFVIPAARFGILPEEEATNGIENLENIDTKKIKKGASYENHTPLFNVTKIELTEEEILEDAEWYRLDISRELAESILVNKPDGYFFIRKSTSNPGCFVMTLKVPEAIKKNRVLNYLVDRTDEGFVRVKGFQHDFKSLIHLVAFYATSTDLELPIQLYLDSDAPIIYVQLQQRRQKEEEQQHYQALQDLDDVDYLDGHIKEFDIEYAESDECSDDDYLFFSSNAGMMSELNQM